MISADHLVEVRACLQESPAVLPTTDILSMPVKSCSTTRALWLDQTSRHNLLSLWTNYPTTIPPLQRFQHLSMSPRSSYMQVSPSVATHSPLENRRATGGRR